MYLLCYLFIFELLLFFFFCMCVGAYLWRLVEDPVLSFDHMRLGIEFGSLGL